MRAARRRSILGIAAAAAIAVAAACGGESDSGPLTLEEFRDQANAVCRDADMQLESVPEPMSPDELAGALEDALPLQREQVDDLRDIEPPDELAERYGDALDLLNDQIAIGQQALDDITGGGEPADVVVTLGPELESNDERLDEIATELGLADCTG